MFAAGKTAVSGVAPDNKFNYVTMLLHGDGTNGAQNNTFLDSSTNNFDITQNGNTTQGSFSPYGSNWSNYFDGSTAYLQVADNTAFDFGSGDFTIEFWMNASTLETGTLQPIINKGTNYVSLYAPFDISRDGTDVRLWLGTSSGWSIAGGVTIGTIVIGQWSHFAVTRSGTTFKAFQDGVQTWTTTSSSALLVTTYPFRLATTSSAGSFFNGYLSNVRLVKGTAVYTSSFTPSTTPLTAITNTSLLTCQSNRFIDNSSNAFGITTSETNVSVQRFNPFGTSTTYSTAVIGGSGFFDGDGDYLSILNNSAFAITSNAFTAEAWVYPTAISSSWQSIAGVWDTANGLQWIIQYRATGVRIFINDGSFTSFASFPTITKGQWHHIVIQRDGSNVASIYVNGTRVNTGSYTRVGNASTAPLNIGRNGDNSEYVTGYISDFKFVKNSAIYSGATITVPTSPATTSNSPAVLTNFTNGALFDNGMMNNGLTVNNAQVNTTIKKFGTGSIKFVRTAYSNGDFLSFPKSPNYDLSGGPFTIEGWIYPTLFDGQYQTIVSRTPTIWVVGLLDNQLYWYNGASTNVMTGTITVNTWTHFAVAGDGTTVRIFINGTLDSSFTGVNPQSGLGTLNVGAPANGTYGGRYTGQFYTGYIDDLRITKGFCRYTANFTPPTAAFSDTGPY